MKAGTSQKTITPKVGLELCGFAARVQPSIGVYDDLFARSLYLENDGRKILWIHCDLIGFDNDISLRIRRAAASRLSLAEKDVFLSATHTHSGPATVFLRYCGNIDTDYLDYLTNVIVEGAQEAAGHLEDVQLNFFETRLEGISMDRRKASLNSHTDTILPVLCLRRNDGSCKAVIANYALHNVGLSSANRHISADIAGYAAQLSSSKIDGHPLVLLTNGGCGNINPTTRADDYSEAKKIGSILAMGIIAAVEQSHLCPENDLSATFFALELPQENLSPGELESIIEQHREDFENSNRDYVNTRVFAAYCQWYAETLAIIEKKQNHTPASAYIHVLKIGPAIFAGMNMEVFSSMAKQLRQASGQSQLYVVGYCDGCIGYLAPRQIYAEGGYEVEGAYKFYGNFRLSPGGFEIMLAKATDIVTAIKVQSAAARPDKC